MISHIRGTLLEASPSSVVVDCNGLGYELGISARSAATLPALGSQVELFVRTRFTSESMTLYAFSNKEERHLYDCLVAVNGIGPKAAMSVLSKYNVSEVFQIVMTDDVTSMSKVPGVGKKTAQRLILELKSVFEADKSSFDLASAQGIQMPLEPAAVPDALADVSSALLSMGFTSSEIELAVKDIDASLPVEKFVGIALRRLGMSA